MWIRSQDRHELVKVERVNVENKKVYGYLSTVIDDCSWIVLGEYKCNENALDQLDYIQNAIESGKNFYVMEIERNG